VASSGNNNLDDLMGVFGGSGGTVDIMNGFGGLDLGGPASQPPPPQQQQKKANEDILGLF
jgi:AP-1 complex subunit beta-1